MKLRSKSCKEESLQIESCSWGRAAPTSMQDMRSYRANYAGSFRYPHQIAKEVKLKKGKSTVGEALKSWSLNNPELQRKKRVAGYKVYGVEGKMKGSLRKSFKWIKNTYTQAVYGWW